MVYDDDMWMRAARLDWIGQDRTRRLSRRSLSEYVGRVDRNDGSEADF